MKPQKENPLRKFLNKNSITQRELAAVMSALRGGKVYPHHICNWCSGRIRPNAATMYFIELATSGSVSRKSWNNNNKSSK